MKKSLFTLIALLVFGFSASAQFTVGLKVGGSYAGFSGSDSEKEFDTGVSTSQLDNMYGGHAGVFFNYRPTEDGIFSIQPEVLWSMKGAKTADEKFEVDLAYLDVPVLARVNADFLFFEVGPQVSALLSGTSELENNNGTITEDSRYARTADLKNLVFGYAAGLGVQSQSIGLSLGVRYTGDFTKLYDPETSPNYRNSVFMVSLGYTLPFNRE
jgi:hypothetical protein